MKESFICRHVTESVGFEPTRPDRTTAFRVQLVMTTSITLQLFELQYGSRFNDKSTITHFFV